MKEMQKSIKTKRDQFLKNIIDQFLASDEEKTIYKCFDYLNIGANLSMETFLNSLSQEEKDKIQNNYLGWFPHLDNISFFNVFIQNIEYQDKFTS